MILTHRPWRECDVSGPELDNWTVNTSSFPINNAEDIAPDADGVLAGGRQLTWPAFGQIAEVAAEGLRLLVRDFWNAGGRTRKTQSEVEQEENRAIAMNIFRDCVVARFSRFADREILVNAASPSCVEALLPTTNTRLEHTTVTESVIATISQAGLTPARLATNGPAFSMLFLQQTDALGVDVAGWSALVPAAWVYSDEAGSRKAHVLTGMSDGHVFMHGNTSFAAVSHREINAVRRLYSRTNRAIRLMPEHEAFLEEAISLREKKIGFEYSSAARESQIAELSQRLRDARIGAGFYMRALQRCVLHCPDGELLTPQALLPEVVASRTFYDLWRCVLLEFAAFPPAKRVKKMRGCVTALHAIQRVSI